MSKPYYRVHGTIRVLKMYVDGSGSSEAQAIHIDPRIEYPLNVDFVMPNDTVKVTVGMPEGPLSGLLIGSRAIEIANFSSLFDGQFNDHATHKYMTKRDIERISLFCQESGRWDHVPVMRSQVEIVERTDRAFKLRIKEKDRMGWSRSFAEIELTEFGRMFDGRFNRNGSV